MVDILCTNSIICTVFQKILTFEFSVTLSNLNRFSKFLHCWKALKCATKHIRQYPPHLRHVTTLHWEIKSLLFCRYSADMKENANIFKMWSLSSFRLQIKFSMPLFFSLFTIVINLRHQKFVIADIIAVVVNKQHGIQRRGQDFDKKFVFQEVHGKEINRRISWKSWTKGWC